MHITRVLPKLFIIKLNIVWVYRYWPLSSNEGRIMNKLVWLVFSNATVTCRIWHNC